MQISDQPVPATSDPLALHGLDGFAPYLMNRIMGRYNENLRRDLKALGLTTSQMRVLAVLAVNDGILIGQLSVYAVVEQSTLTRVVDKLVQSGHLRRGTDPDDSRAIRVFLEPDGRAAYESLRPALDRNYSAMFADVPDKEVAEFVTTLQKLLNNIRSHNY